MSETRDEANRRRRWVTLAELVAFAGVVIAGLGFWNSWSERRAAETEKAAERSSEQRARARLDLVGTVSDGGRRIAISDATHELTDVGVRFPTALGITPQTPVEPGIDADWFRQPMLKLTDRGADDRTGRLPVLVTASFWDGDVKRQSAAIYDVIWRTQGQMLGGRKLRLEGFRLRERAGTPARLEVAWKQAGLSATSN